MTDKWPSWWQVGPRIAARIPVSLLALAMLVVFKVMGITDLSWVIILAPLWIAPAALVGWVVLILMLRVALFVVENAFSIGRW